MIMSIIILCIMHTKTWVHSIQGKIQCITKSLSLHSFIHTFIHGYLWEPTMSYAHIFNSLVILANTFSYITLFTYFQLRNTWHFLNIPKLPLLICVKQHGTILFFFPSLFYFMSWDTMAFFEAISRFVPQSLY